jgi:hypothetical protein
MRKPPCGIKGCALELRFNGELHARNQQRNLNIAECGARVAPSEPALRKPVRKDHNAGGKSLARRDPGKTVRTYHEDFQSALKIGTFYLAGNRNFLFGSDIASRNHRKAKDYLKGL